MEEQISEKKLNEGGREVTYTLVASMDEFKKSGGQMTRWASDSHDILLYEFEGALVAYSNICRHFGGPVGFHKAKEGVFTCLWHNWQYSCQDGACLTVPGLALRRYPVKVIENNIYVNLLG